MQFTLKSSNVWMLSSWKCTIFGRHPPGLRPSYRSTTYQWVCWNIFRESQCPDSNGSRALATGQHDDGSKRRRDEVLASTLSKTEIIVLKFYSEGCCSQRRDQALLNMLRHRKFRVEDVESIHWNPSQDLNLWRLSTSRHYAIRSLISIARCAIKT